MYPYLRPAGVIMKIEKEPLPSPQENAALWKDIVAKDKLYWDTLTREFTNREEFVRNNDAKKSFSKMRSAIAGLYQFRGMADEAIYAYKQSLDLCPESPEGCFRLADLYMQQHRYDDARLLMENYLKLDEYNDNVINFLHQLTDMSKMDTRRRELEESVKKGANITAIMELLTVYGKLNQGNEFSGLAMNMLNATNLPPAVYLQLAQVCGNARQPNIALEAVKRYLAHDARNSAVWIEQGLLQFTIGQNNEGMASLRKAVEVGGEAARNALRNDARFEPLRNQPAFQSLIQAQPTVFNMSNGGLGMP
jgi:tetratricopeptide (TPR) repeat protein